MKAQRPPKPGSARDLRYGRRGGGWTDDPDAGHRTEGPPCDECGRPMLLGQRNRHHTCGPKCPTCFMYEQACTCGKGTP